MSNHLITEADIIPGRFFHSVFTVILVVFILLLSGLVGCDAPQTTRAEPVASPTPLLNLSATAQALSSTIAENGGLSQTSKALDNQASQPQEPLPSEQAKDGQAIPSPEAEAPPASTIPNLPADLPIPPGDQRDLFSSRNMVSFLMQNDIQQLILFFENQMPINGWNKVMAESFITDGSAYSVYTKDNRKVSISLRFNSISNLTGLIITFSD